MDSVYPANLACWDGKVSEHWQKEEHPLATLPALEEVKLPNKEAALIPGVKKKP